MTITASGVCDEDDPQALCRLDGEGTLTIYGTGRVFIYPDTPWDEYAQNVRTFRAERGITNVSVDLKNYLDQQKPTLNAFKYKPEPPTITIGGFSVFI